MNKKFFAAEPMRSFLCLAVGVFVSTAHAETMTATSWGGAYSKSQVEAMQKPFTASTGIQILPEEYNGGLAEIQAQVKTGNVKWDVVDVELAEALRGCDDGLFETVDASRLPAGADGMPAAQDFIKGRLTKCAVGSVFYSNVVAYDKARYAANGPKTIEDFFDLKKFPGKRGLKPYRSANWDCDSPDLLRTARTSTPSGPTRRSSTPGPTKPEQFRAARSRPPSSTDTLGPCSVEP